MFYASTVKMEDFPKLLELSALVEKAVENGEKYFVNASKCIDFSYEAMQGYVINSLTAQGFKMFVMKDGDNIIGFMTGMVHDIPMAKSMGFTTSKQLFVPTMFKLPGVQDGHTEVMVAMLERWGAHMKAEGLYGNVRPDGALGVFLEKYGAKEISRTLYRKIGEERNG